MTNINVMFELSEEIVKGLANGTLERVGGVVRRVGDKKIVVWLTEAGAEVSREAGLPSILNSPQMLMGMQVANLAVSVAGFALIYHKLQQVQRQIEGIDQKLQALSDAHAWLDKKHLIEHLAPMCIDVRVTLVEPKTEATSQGARCMFVCKDWPAHY